MFKNTDGLVERKRCNKTFSQEAASGGLLAAVLKHSRLPPVSGDGLYY
jgi:hypothetical protein